MDGIAANGRRKDGIEHFRVGFSSFKILPWMSGAADGRVAPQTDVCRVGDSAFSSLNAGLKRGRLLSAVVAVGLSSSYFSSPTASNPEGKCRGGGSFEVMVVVFSVVGGVSRGWKGRGSLLALKRVAIIILFVISGVAISGLGMKRSRRGKDRFLGAKLRLCRLGLGGNEEMFGRL